MTVSQYLHYVQLRHVLNGYSDMFRDMANETPLEFWVLGTLLNKQAISLIYSTLLSNSLPHYGKAEREM